MCASLPFLIRRVCNPRRWCGRSVRDGGNSIDEFEGGANEKVIARDKGLTTVRVRQIATAKTRSLVL
jgi:hypothetical protein